MRELALDAIPQIAFSTTLKQRTSGLALDERSCTSRENRAICADARVGGDCGCVVPHSIVITNLPLAVAQRIELDSSFPWLVKNLVNAQMPGQGF